MALTERQEAVATATTTTKATTGGTSGLLAPAISTAIIKGLETYFMFELSAEVELMIISVVTGVVTYWLVWFLPNRPKVEVTP
jgi:hypothetical protein